MEEFRFVFFLLHKAIILRVKGNTPNNGNRTVPTTDRTSPVLTRLSIVLIFITFYICDQTNY